MSGDTPEVDESSEPEPDPDPGVIESVGLWLVGFLRSVIDSFRVGKQAIATAIARRAGRTDEPDKLTDGDTEEREKRLEERAESIADTIDGTIGVLLRKVVNMFRMMSFTAASLGLRYIPKTGAVADQLIRSGMNLKKNVTGADALVFSAYGDRKVIPQPASWDSDQTRYVTSNGEQYSAKGEGHNPYHLEGVPVVFTLRASAEVFEPIQAHLANLREYDSWVSYIRDQDDKREILMGQNMPDPDADGMVLNWNKAWEQHYQKIDQEDLQEQHRLGRLAELDSDAKMKVVLIALGCFVGGIVAMLGILFILDQLGGTSGTISLFMGTGWLL